VNPLSIKARNYRTFDELDLDLPEGCVAILGENGAGKSSIVNLIDLALFGPESRTLADCLSDDTVEENLMLELLFEHAGGTYRVRRTYSPRGRGQTKVDLERLGESTTENGHGLTASTAHAAWWEPLTRETAAATQTAIEELLGLSRETFRASAFLAQGDGAAFTEAQPRDRKRILAEVLGLDLWDRLLERARTDRRNAEVELVQVDTVVTGAEVELAGRSVIEEERTAASGARTSAELRISQAEGELTIVNERLAKARAMEAASVSAEAALESARQAHGAALTRESSLRHELEALSERLSGRVALDALSSQLPALEAEREGLQQRTQQADEHERVVIERNRLLGEASVRNEQAHGLRDQGTRVLTGTWTDTCDRCGQVLGKEAAQVAADSYNADARKLDLEAADLDEQAAALTARIETLPAHRPTAEELARIHDLVQRAQNALVQIAALDEAASRSRILDEQLSECRGSIPGLEQQVTTAQANLRALLPEDGALSLPELDEQQRDLNALIVGFRNAAAAAAETLARCDERLDRMNRLAEAVKLNAKRRDELHGEIDILCELERAYGRDGIPALIVENSAIPQIEVEASRILTELGTSYRVELRTERALKSGDGTRDTLDVIVVGDAGERPYETFSGGERTRINLALRIALARLLAHRRGAESRALIIDEPEYLDEPGTAKLADVLRNLAQSGDFDKVMLVSHVPGLRDAFDQTLEVVKDGSRSRVVEIGAREEVAA
jgi:exonuclease SbcC